MTHRVHTILSILAEDHAPAALRPSILLAIDWPTVAEEAPATGNDSGLSYIASVVMSGPVDWSKLLPQTAFSFAAIAARLATVAASLAATGDKAHALHAAALWGAAAALVGMPTTAPLAANPAGWDGLINGIASLTHVLPFCSRADEMLDIVMRWHGAENALNALANKASGIIPGAKHTNLGDRATLIATALDRVRDMKAERDAARDERDERDANKRGEDAADRVLNLVRKALGWEMGKGMLSDFAAAIRKRADEADSLRAENTRLRAQVDRMIAAMREDAPAPVKARPQPGDVVPWTEVEDGCLYYVSGDVDGARFRVALHGTTGCMLHPNDLHLGPMLHGTYRGTLGAELDGYPGYPKAVFVARDLGSDPEAWRRAMREWTEKGGK